MGASLDRCSVVSFKGTQAGVEQFALRDDHDVESGRDLVATKNLSNQSFRSVPLHRTTKFPGGGDAQTAHAVFIRQQKHRGVSSVNANAPAVDLLEFRTSANMLSGAESQTLLAAGRKALATLRPSAFQDQTAVFCGHSD